LAYCHQVGKMVNVARMIGLGIDPDDVPGTYTLFDAEARRRIWWDIFYYDLSVSFLFQRIRISHDRL
jgi:Fungal specific transcription factor domain